MSSTGQQDAATARARLKGSLQPPRPEIGAGAKGAVRVRPEKMPLLRLLRRETEREETRELAEGKGWASARA